jgi:hypothetical protein
MGYLRSAAAGLASQPGIEQKSSLIRRLGVEALEQLRGVFQGFDFKHRGFTKICNRSSISKMVRPWKRLP